MNKCERIEKSIGPWLDHELSAAESEVVRAHVTACSRCSEARQRLERLDRALSSLLVDEAPKIGFASFWRELEHRIEQKRPWHKRFLEQAGDWISAPRSAWAVPALIAVLIAVLSYQSYFPFSRSRNNFATVESIDSYGRNVALLREDESKTTVIWLYQNQEGDDEAADETPPAGPAF
jgi:hypothetical protein